MAAGLGIRGIIRIIYMQENPVEKPQVSIPSEIGVVRDVVVTEGEPSITLIRFIHQYNDGYGRIVYGVSTRRNMRGIPWNKIRPLALKIERQKEAFSQLDQETKLRTQQGFATGAEEAKPYQEFLDNNVLEKRYIELQDQIIPHRTAPR